MFYTTQERVNKIIDRIIYLLSQPIKSNPRGINNALLLGINACDSKMPVDSIDEEIPTVDFNQSLKLDVAEINLDSRTDMIKSDSVSIDVLSSPMVEMLKKLNLYSDQLNPSGLSDRGFFKKGKEGLDNQGEIVPFDKIDPCNPPIDDRYCGPNYPPPPPPEEPVIELSRGSFINYSEHAGLVQMSSISASSEPIDYIEVIGLSYRDYFLIYSLADGGENTSFAGVAITEYKSSIEPETVWMQNGAHLFVIGNQAIQATSSARETF